MWKDLNDKLDESLSLMSEIRDLLTEVCGLLREGRLGTVNVHVDSNADPAIIAEQVREEVSKEMFRTIK